MNPSPQIPTNPAAQIVPSCSWVSSTRHGCRLEYTVFCVHNPEQGSRFRRSSSNYVHLYFCGSSSGYENASIALLAVALCLLDSRCWNGLDRSGSWLSRFAPRATAAPAVSPGTPPVRSLGGGRRVAKLARVNGKRLFLKVVNIEYVDIFGLCCAWSGKHFRRIRGCKKQV